MEKLRGRTKIEKNWQTVEIKTTDYAVTAADTGKILAANKAGTFTFTLPAVGTAKGCVWRFIQMQDQNLVITTTTGNVMIAKNLATADTVTYSTASNKIGAACEVICDGTYYYFFNLSSCTDTPST